MNHPREKVDAVVVHAVRGTSGKQKSGTGREPKTDKQEQIFIVVIGLQLFVDLLGCTQGMTN